MTAFRSSILVVCILQYRSNLLYSFNIVRIQEYHQPFALICHIIVKFKIHDKMSESRIELQESIKLINNDSIQELISDNDRKIIRRVRWKTDLIILPLLLSIHFLAQMVTRTVSLGSVHWSVIDNTLGTFRSCKRQGCRSRQGL